MTILGQRRYLRPWKNFCEKLCHNFLCKERQKRNEAKMGEK